MEEGDGGGGVGGVGEGLGAGGLGVGSVGPGIGFGGRGSTCAIVREDSPVQQFKTSIAIIKK